MQSGSVKYWNDEKGYGFINVDNQTEDVFFHISTWQSSNYPSEGLKVNFESERNQKGLRATKVMSQANNPSHTHKQSNQSNVYPHNNTNSKKLTKGLLSTALSVLVLLVAVFFGGSELLTDDNDNKANNNSYQSDTTINLPSSPEQIPHITGDTQIDNTIALIKQGGPFPYPHKDGTTFYNREGRLPKQPKGFYREYTVPTPGISHRGARRIVTGGNPPTFYYLTLDHYETFTQLEVD